MARVNVEDEIWNDNRFFKLSVALGGKDRAIGQLVVAWRTAQPFWKNGQRGIPIDRWESEELSAHLIEVGLARFIEGEVFVRGADKAFDWIQDKKEIASIAGQKSAEARRLKYGSAQPLGGDGFQPGTNSLSAERKPNGSRTEPERTRTTRTKPNEPERAEPSSLLSSSLLKEEIPNTKDIPPSAAQSTAPAVRAPRVPRVKKAQVVTGGSEIWQAYAEAFEQRYGKEPSVRGAKQNSVCAQIAKQAGVERGSVAVRHYVQHNEPFYLRNRHAIEHCLKDLHTLAEQAESDIFITSNDARSTTVGTTIAEVIRQREKQGGG
jgi:hypothetical protein